MSPDLERLINLQQLDSTIDEAQRRIAAHPDRLAAADARLNAAKEMVERAKGRLKDNQEARRAIEKDAALFQGRVGKFKDQLSEVKTNREYQAIQVEIETAQRELAAVEENVLERMMDADVIAVEITQAESALAVQQKEVDREKAVLAQELADLQAALASASEARASLLKEMTPRLIALFEQVARARKGVAICSATRDGLCSVCHVRLRPQVFQLVRQNDSIIQCDSCQRILYYVPPPAPAEPPVTHPL
jgi:predicted  nucleic acid-binding Zn-ribbon protein